MKETMEFGSSNEWISVEDRLPDKNVGVLTLTDGDVIQGSYDPTEEDVNDRWYYVKLRIHGCGCCGTESDKTTHWQQLPDPPK